METVELHSYSELFNSLDSSEPESHDQQIVVHSLSDLLGEYVDDDFNIDDIVDNYSSSEGGDEVIDIETIDELEGIMDIPDSRQTFTSPSCRVLPKTSSAPKKKIVVIEKGATIPAKVTSLSVPVVPNRVRLNSEAIITVLVALEDKLSDASPADGKSEEVIEPSLEPLTDESVIIETEIDKQNFSLLGIDGIEADDLESLFLKFEGAENDVEESPSEIVCETTITTSLNTTTTNTLPTPRPKALTLERYRELRGLSSAPSTAPSSAPSSPPSVVVSDLSQTAPESQVKPSGYKLTPVDIPATVQTPPNRALLHKLSYFTSLDHDYCSKSKPKVKDPPTTSVSQTTENSDENRDYKFEIMSLLCQIPQYVGNTLSLVSTPEPISTSKLAESTVVQTSSPILPGVPPPSSSSSSHNQPITLVGSSNPRSLLATKTVGVPPAIVETEVKIESTSPSTAVLSLPSPLVPTPMLTSPHASGLTLSATPPHEKEATLPRAYLHNFRRSRHKRRRSRRRRRWSSSEESLSPVPSYRKRRRSSTSRHSSDEDDLYESSESYDSQSDDSSSCSSCAESRYSRSSHRKGSSRKTHRRKNATKRRRSSRRRSRSSPRRGRRHKSGRRSHRRLSRDGRSSSRSVSPRSSISSRRTRSPSPPSSDRETTKRRKDVDAAHATAMTERRVVYVGGIGSRYSRTDLKQRFGGFGEIERVSIHTRSNGEDYGFVTFYSKADAYAAIEKGNDVYGPKFNLGFGGRRMFCDTQYADLDGCQAVKEEWATNMRKKASVDDDFDALLKQTIKKVAS